MKLSTLVLSVISVVSTSAAVAGFVTLKRQGTVPPQSARIGLVFDMPCEEHGTDKVTIEKTELVRFYHLTGNPGEEMDVDQDLLLRGLKELGVSPK